MVVPPLERHSLTLQSLVVNILLHIYGAHAFPETAKKNRNTTYPARADYRENLDYHDTTPTIAQIRTHSQSRHIRDAQDFELEGLIGASDRDRFEEASPTASTPPPVPPKPDA